MRKAILLIALIALPAAAQSTIDSTDRYAHGANTGWIDFRPSAADGVQVSGSYLAGHAYAANFGWFNFGDGSPDNGYNYANASATDYGVNISGDGKLSGYAWAANIGWINFEQTHGQAKVDLITGQVTGSAWAANTGWISLDTPNSDLKTHISRPDIDGDGIADAWEYEKFNGLVTADATSNFDGDPQSDLAEYQADTRPNDHNSYLRIISHSHTQGPASTSTITFTSISTRLYRLEYDSDLVGFWTNSSLDTFAPDPGSSTIKTISRPNEPRYYFRAVSVLPLPAP